METPQRGSEELRRVVLGGVLGQTVEWYDYGLYGLLAPQIGQTFFPSKDSATSLLTAFAVFGIAFVARPLGGMILGPLGDRVGRRHVLTITLVIMTVATLLVGLLPGRATIGIAAPLLLVVARMIQGISAGGEVTSAITYVAEFAPENKRGMYTGLLQSGSAAGFVLATAIILVLQLSMTDATFNLWGWRVPFYLALVLGAVGLYIRFKLRESPVFEDLLARGEVSSAPLREAFTVGWPQLLQGTGLAALMFVSYSIFLSYVPNYMRVLGFSPATASKVSLFAIFVIMFAHPMAGALSDRFGRRKLLTISSLFFLFLSWPLFSVMSTAEPALIVGALIVMALATAGYVGVAGALFTEFLAARTRMASFSTGYNLGGAIFGGPTLFVPGYLVATTGDNRSPAYYLMFAALVSLAALATIRTARDRVASGYVQTPVARSKAASHRPAT